VFPVAAVVDAEILGCVVGDQVIAMGAIDAADS